jgi:WD40 repeat protein
MFWKAHERYIRSLALAPDLSSIISGDMDGSVYEWNIQTGEKLKVIRQPIRKGQGVSKIVYSPNGSKLGVSWNYGLMEGQLEIYDTSSWELQYIVQSKEVFDFDWSPNGEHLALASGGIRIIDSANGAIIPTPRMGHDSWTNCVAYTPDGNKIVSAGDFYDASYGLWDARTFDKLAKVYTPEDEHVEIFQPFHVIYISNDEVIINDLGYAVQWNFSNGSLDKIFDYPQNEAATPTCISVDGRIYAYPAIHGYEAVPNWMELYSGESWARPKKIIGATVKVQDLRTSQLLYTFEGYNDMVTCLVFSPDTRKLFTGDWEGHIRIWELQN